MADNAIKLAATNRTRLGKGASRQARRDGKVPAVVYGHGAEPRHLLLDEHATRMALRGNENALIELSVEGQPLLVLTKEVQRHPIRPGVQHVDFLLVNRNERVEVEVPVTVVGEAVPSTMHIIELAHVLLSAPVTSIPETVEVDVTGVQAGTAIRVADLTLPQGVEAVTEAETDIVNITEDNTVVEETEAPADAAEAQ